MKPIQNYAKIFLLTLLIAGCAPMEAVQKYATVTKTTVASIRPVAEDFYLSCTRSNSFKPYDVQSPCRTEREASRAILLVAQVLEDYATVLATLAADDVVRYDGDIDALIKEINQLQVEGLNAQKVSAVGSLAKLVANAATEGYRQRKMGLLLGESDGAVVEVSATLADLLSINYVQALDLELSAERETYRLIEKTRRDETSHEWLTFAKAQMQERAALEAKRDAAIHLAAQLLAVAATHSQLKDDAAELKGEEVAALVGRFSKEVKPVIQEIQDAF